MQEARQKLLLHIPICASLISEKIIFKVLDCHLKNEALNVKVIFADLNTSTMGIRYHFNKLIDEDWISLNKTLKDKRIKLVLPSEKLLIQINVLTDDLDNNLITDAYSHNIKFLKSP